MLPLSASSKPVFLLAHSVWMLTKQARMQRERRRRKETPHQTVPVLRTTRSALPNSLPLLLVVMIDSPFLAAWSQTENLPSRLFRSLVCWEPLPHFLLVPQAEVLPPFSGSPGPSAHASFTGSVLLIIGLETSPQAHRTHAFLILLLWCLNSAPWIGQVCCPPLSYLP